MIEIGRLPAQKLVTIRVRGELTGKDYEDAIPELEQAFEEADNELNAVVQLDDLRGWDLESFWKQIKFDVDHHDDFRRIAIVGQTSAEKSGAEESSNLTSAEVDFFLLDEVDDAQAWATAS